MVSATPSADLRKLRLCFLGYRRIRELAMQVVVEFAERAEIEVVDATFAGALEIARDRLDRGMVDAFVSAGANANVLRKGLDAPVATIEVSGFDLFQALLQARAVSGRIGVVVYGNIIPELDAVRALLNIEVAQTALPDT